MNEHVSKTIDGIAAVVISFLFGGISLTQMGTMIGILAGIMSAIAGCLGGMYYWQAYLGMKEQRAERHKKEMLELAAENQRLLDLLQKTLSK